MTGINDAISGKHREVLTGWGRTSPSAAHVVPVTDEQDIASELAEPTERGVIARGLGRSYGDSAQNAGGLVFDMTHYNSIDSFDSAAGVVDVQAG
ncbi:MAG: FAD-binding protein, partial [Actinomycetes bacterium]